MTPVAFGPSDFFALLKAAWNFQTREVYAPKGCSNSENSIFGIFSGAQQMPMGNNDKKGP
jgi:hypothetical protein